VDGLTGTEPEAQGLGDQEHRWEPAYQRTIRSPRLQGPAALLAAVGALDPDGPWGLGVGSAEQLELAWSDVMRESLVRAVGGENPLRDLDDRPLPDEEFVWEGIP
jgi:hypothetical protein